MATGQLDSDMERRILTWMFTDSYDTSLPLVQPVTVRLMATNGDEDTAGVEIAGDSYEPADSSWAQTTTTPGAEFSNTVDVEFNSLDQDSTVSVAGIELWDSNTTSPTRVAFATFDTVQDVAAGDPFVITTGTIKVYIG